MAFFDRLGGIYARGPEFSQRDRESVGAQGLLNLGLGLLTGQGGFGNALANGIQGGLLSMQDGANQLVNDRYRQAMMQRTMAGMDRNNQMDAIRSQVLNQDGSINRDKLNQAAILDPEWARNFQEFSRGPQQKWVRDQIGDGQGGLIDVWSNPETRQVVGLDGQPIVGAEPAAQPQGGLLGVSPGLGGQDIGILRNAVEQQESGGNPFAVSPKGAVGPMQTMPGTLTSPGFGVAPARDNSVEEQRRVGNDYLQAMVGKYGVVGGLAAYNWGPGNWEAALNSSGGDPRGALSKAPKETQDYVPSVLKRTGGQASPQSLGIGRRPAKAKEAPEETFGNPQEVMDPATNTPVLVQFGNRGSIRKVNGFGAPQNAAAANKEAMQVEKQVTSLSKRLSDENVPLIDTQLNTIEGALRPYLDTKGKVVKDIPGYGQLDSFVPDMVAGGDARDIRQQVATLANVILKSRSGAAVTDSELRRFLQEAGTNKGMPESQLVNGIKLVRNWFDAQKRNIRGGYSPQVLQDYYRNAPENEGLLGSGQPKPQKPAGQQSGWSIQRVN